MTVKGEGQARVRDVELSADLPVERIVTEVAEGLGWSTDHAGNRLVYDVEAHPPGRNLRGDETLAQAQVWDGAWLVFRLRNEGPVQEPPTVVPPLVKPVTGWKPLDGTSRSFSPPDP